MTRSKMRQKSDWTTKSLCFEVEGGEKKTIHIEISFSKQRASAREREKNGEKTNRV